MTAVKCLSSIADIDASDWNAIVTRNHLICTHEYLCAVEASRINDCQCFYPVVYDGNRIVAHACVYVIRTELDSFARGKLKGAIGHIRRFWSNFLILHSVECGTPVALGSTVTLSEGADGAAATGQIVREVEDIARDQGVGVILFRDFDSNQIRQYDSLCRRGYTRLQNLPEARLDVRWARFEEYLDSMRSQYRCKLVSQMDRFRKSGCVLELIPDFSLHARDLAALWKNAYDHAKEYRREVLTPCFFENIDSHLGSSSAVILAREGSAPVGFLLLLLEENTMTTLFSGLDYSRSRECGIYFNLFYEAIKLAIDMGMKSIHFGITTLAPKIDLGARVVPLYMYMKHLNPMLNRVVPRAFASMTPPSTLKPRRVFKV